MHAFAEQSFVLPDCSLSTAKNSVNGAFMPALALAIDSGSENAIWSVEVETRLGLTRN